MLERLALFNIFIGLPVWGSYTGDNMLLWMAVALLLMLPAVILLRREIRKEDEDER